MRGFGTTIFSVMSALSDRHEAINLGQGFPDEAGPAPVLAEAVRAIETGINQYPPLTGSPVLREAVAAHQQRFHGIDLDPQSEVLVTGGATEGLSVALLTLCEPGDEVVLFDPSYDAYSAAIALAGATRRSCPLRMDDLSLDVSTLRAAVGPRTRAIIVNTPHNPTGKVFTAAELTAIGVIAKEAGCWVICDEVYEHLVYDGATHISLAALARQVPELEGLSERVVSLSSAGKTFSVTGWKVGWATGPAAAIEAMTTVKQYLSFTGGAPFQPAVALGLGQSDSAYRSFTEGMRDRRDLLARGLTQAGLPVLGGQGTYFLLADTAALGVRDAAALCRELPRRIGVSAIPVSAFCDDPELAPTLVRFAYCKSLPTLQEAVRRLQTPWI